MYGAAGLSRRYFSKRKSEKKDTWQLFGEFSCSTLSGLLPTQPCSAPVVAQKAPEFTPQAPGRVRDWRLLGNWPGVWPSVDQEQRKVKPIPPQPAAAKKTSKNGLATSKPAGGCFLFYLIILYLFLIFSFDFFFLSFILSCFIPSSFLSLFLSSSFFPFFLIPTSETIKPETVKTPELDPKSRHPKAETVSQISLCYSTEHASYYIFVLLLFSLFLHLSFY